MNRKEVLCLLREIIESSWLEDSCEKVSTAKEFQDDLLREIECLIKKEEEEA